ncbi:MAG: hypothetical protein EP330_27890 [Deltaproteobacteria bacterium]|nr:MAG: hypothetical protein EP330_27890 [Deltaproteobacteria bacterium]
MWPGDYCLSEPTLRPGAYSGTLASNLNDFSAVCGSAQAEGREGSVIVDVPAGQTLTVDYRSVGADAVLYFLETCPVMSSCLDLADNTGDGGVETLSWQNTGGTTVSVHVFLDNWSSLSGGAFELDIDVQ